MNYCINVVSQRSEQSVAQLRCYGCIKKFLFFFFIEDEEGRENIKSLSPSIMNGTNENKQDPLLHKPQM